jgi:hypothetical protein
MLLRNALCCIALMMALMPAQGVYAQDLPVLEKAVQSFARATVPPRFTYVWVDLNGDGRPDAVVLMQGEEFCGSGGCTMAIFKGATNGFTLLSTSTITSKPIRVLPEVQYGWKTLIVTTHGVSPAIMRFNGARYPLNPSMQATATLAQLSAAAPLTLQDCACGD